MNICFLLSFIYIFIVDILFLLLLMEILLVEMIVVVLYLGSDMYIVCPIG
jgi:hypothetical protein